MHSQKVCLEKELHLMQLLVEVDEHLKIKSLKTKWMRLDEQENDGVLMISSNYEQ